ncbi:MAG: phage portal protein, partial [Chloroflexi bacterium]|nr:phage portal protein [Chloroflexota bacterium]
FRPEEVVHFRWWAAGSGRRAASSLEALRTTLMTEDATQRMTIASFENGARPEGAFSVDGVLKPEEMERARAVLQQTYGGVDNAFKLAVLDHGAKWISMSHTLVDSELINLRKLTREEVAAAYNIPPPVIGILDRATFSNISEQHLMEYMDTIQPWTTMIEEDLAVQLIDLEPTMAGQYAEFDFNAVLAGDPVRRIEVLTKAIGGPFMTANEGRATQNLPPLPDTQAERLAPPANASVKGDGSGGNG